MSRDSNGAHAIDPTPEEIARRAAKIRRGWSEGQRRRRRVVVEQHRWLPPVVTVDELNACDSTIG